MFRLSSSHSSASSSVFACLCLSSSLSASSSSFFRVFLYDRNKKTINVTGPLESDAVYCAAAEKQRLAPRLQAAPLFAFLLAAQFVLKFAVLQLTGECIAHPSTMICAVAMSRADSGMGVGSSSFSSFS